jgi:signal transduction histidine kinase
MMRINDGLALFAHYKNNGKSIKLIPLSELLDTFATAHTGSIRIEVESAARAILVPEAQFHLILDELVKNAIEAVAPGKVPDIRIEGRIAKRAFLGDQLRLKISDNGVGMDGEMLKNVTLPSFSTKAGHHTGLGLTGCLHMLKSMKGALIIQSTPGVGTQMQLIYPLT